MPDDPYTLADLGRLAGVTPRTVRYYVAQGLLPSPEAAGPATRYAEGHLARLRLIKRMQRDHLPLSEIRSRLDHLDDATIAILLAASNAGEPELTTTPADTLAFVRNLMIRTGVTPQTEAPPQAAEPPSGLARALSAYPTPRARVTLRASDVAPDAPPNLTPEPTSPGPAAAAMLVPSTSVATGRSSASPAGDRSTWDRLAITPDVEIHVRRPLDRHANKRVDQLLKIARELFDEEP